MCHLHNLHCMQTLRILGECQQEDVLDLCQLRAILAWLGVPVHMSTC